MKKADYHLIDLCEISFLIYDLFLEDLKNKKLSENAKKKLAISKSKKWLNKKGVLSGVMNPMGIDSNLSPIEFILMYGNKPILEFLKLKMGLT